MPGALTVGTTYAGAVAGEEHCNERDFLTRRSNSAAAPEALPMPGAPMGTAKHTQQEVEVGR